MTGIKNSGDPRTELWIAEVTELAEACKKGDTKKASELLEKHPDVLDSPDRDERFVYPDSQLWSPLYLAALKVR
jgi:hypothetical protein